MYSCFSNSTWRQHMEMVWFVSSYWKNFSLIWSTCLMIHIDFFKKLSISFTIISTYHSKCWKVSYCFLFVVFETLLENIRIGNKIAQIINGNIQSYTLFPSSWLVKCHKFECEHVLCILSFWQCIHNRLVEWCRFYNDSIETREYKWRFKDGEIIYNLFFFNAPYLPIAMHMKETFFFLFYSLSSSAYDIARDYRTAKVFFHCLNNKHVLHYACHAEITLAHIKSIK